jgi:hypothetical protein
MKGGRTHLAHKAEHAVDMETGSFHVRFVTPPDTLRLRLLLTPQEPDVSQPAVYEITIDDATTWRAPWTALVQVTLAQGKLYEYACDDGNLYTMTGVLGVLARKIARLPLRRRGKAADAWLVRVSCISVLMRVDERLLDERRKSLGDVGAVGQLLNH